MAKGTTRNARLEMISEQVAEKWEVRVAGGETSNWRIQRGARSGIGENMHNFFAEQPVKDEELMYQKMVCPS